MEGTDRLMIAALAKGASAMEGFFTATVMMSPL